MKLRQPARKQPTLRGSCRRPRSIGGGSWRKLPPMPQCKLFGETPAGLLDPIDLQHPALGRTWTRPLGWCRHFCGRPAAQTNSECPGRRNRAITVLAALSTKVYQPRALLGIGSALRVFLRSEQVIVSGIYFSGVLPHAAAIKQGA